MKIILCLLAFAALVGCDENKFSEADGAPGGKNSYFPHDNEQRNMSQTGVDDSTISLPTRIEYANEHGLPPPRDKP
jgi:hypothetical protein